MSPSRSGVLFHCGGEALVGILHRPDDPGATGVVIVVGGPQYRVGSHRQFVHLADELARAGFPTLRFDYRGMGDSAGVFRGFESVNDDIAAAVDALGRACPSVRSVVLWGLCDAATAIAFYAADRPGVAGLVMANPWVRTDAGLARSYVENYYGRRLVSREFWRRLLAGELPVLTRLREFLRDWRVSRGAGRAVTGDSLPERLRGSLERFAGPVLLLMSGNDLTAGEFDACLNGEAWGRWRRRADVSRVDFPDADHTFSSRRWRAGVCQATVTWLRGRS